MILTMADVGTRCAEQVDRPGGLRAQKKRQARVDMNRAAIELVAEHGLAHVTVEMIAERAGVSPRTFFNYWDSKEAAVLGVDEEQSTTVLEVLRDAPGEESVRRSLRRAMSSAPRLAPADGELTELKRRVMEREPHLHQLSVGMMTTMQSDLRREIERRLRHQGVADAIARDQAVVLAQFALAAARSAYALAALNGTTIAEQFTKVYEFVDSGTVGA